MAAYDAKRKPGRHSFTDAKLRAEDKGIPFTITRRWFDLRVSIGHCEVTGMKFSKVKPKGAHSAPFVPSIDQIIPAAGYTNENARVVCWCVNASMSTWPDEVFDAMCQARVRKIAQEKAEQHEQQEWIERVVQRAARLQRAN